MATVNKAGLDLIKGFEGCELTSYWDAIGGIYTIGYGHTGLVNGRPITANMTITQDTADAELVADLQTAIKSVEGLVQIALTPNQFAALVSFEFNTGALGQTRGLPLINAKQFHDAWDGHLCLYDHDGNGNVIAGLQRRRNAEKALFFS